MGTIKKIVKNGINYTPTGTFIKNGTSYKASKIIKNNNDYEFFSFDMLSNPVLQSVTAVVDNGDRLTIKWTDPEDAKNNVWQSSVLVRKQGSAPSSVSDGTTVVTITQRNKYKTSGYINAGLTKNTKYYYKVFSYDQYGNIYNSSGLSATTDNKSLAYSYSYSFANKDYTTVKNDGRSVSREDGAARGAGFTANGFGSGEVDVGFFHPINFDISTAKKIRIVMTTYIRSNSNYQSRVGSSFIKSLSDSTPSYGSYGLKENSGMRGDGFTAFNDTNIGRISNTDYQNVTADVYVSLENDSVNGSFTGGTASTRSGSGTISSGIKSSLLAAKGIGVGTYGYNNYIKSIAVYIYA